MKSSLSLQFVNQQFVKTCSSHQKNTSPIGTVPRFTVFAKVHLQHHENEAAQGDEVIMSCYWKLYHIWFLKNKLYKSSQRNFRGFFLWSLSRGNEAVATALKTAQHKMLATQQRGSKCWWSDTRYYEIQNICPNMMLYTTIPPSPSTPALQLHPQHDPLARSKKQSSVTGTAFQSGEYECSFRPLRKHYHNSWRIRNDFLAVRFKASEVDGVVCLIVSSKAKNYEL